MEPDYIEKVIIEKVIGNQTNQVIGNQTNQQDEDYINSLTFFQDDNIDEKEAGVKGRLTKISGWWHQDLQLYQLNFHYDDPTRVDMFGEQSEKVNRMEQHFIDFIIEPNDQIVKIDIWWEDDFDFPNTKFICGIKFYKRLGLGNGQMFGKTNNSQPRTINNESTDHYIWQIRAKYEDSKRYFKKFHALLVYWQKDTARNRKTVALI